MSFECTILDGKPDSASRLERDIAVRNSWQWRPLDGRSVSAKCGLDTRYCLWSGPCEPAESLSNWLTPLWEDDPDKSANA